MEEKTSREPINHFETIAQTNRWLEDELSSLQFLSRQYERHAERYEATGDKWDSAMAQIAARGVAKALDHVDWLGSSLDKWEQVVGY